MGFRCLKRLSCHLSNDSAIETKIRVEAQKVCNKMETVANEGPEPRRARGREIMFINYSEVSYTVWPATVELRASRRRAQS